MYCSSARPAAPATAYELTFSVAGSPLASDEYGNRNFTFSVYFSPDELAPDVRQAIAGKHSRGDIAGSFTVSPSRELVRKTMVDEAESHFCAGNSLGGSWITSDPHCTDLIRYKTVSAPTDYVAVRIDAGPARVGMAQANKAASVITRK
jgi:hypothetical protein